jgi:hypothetical protein
MDRFVFRARFNGHNNSSSVGIGFNINIGRYLPVKEFPVFSDIVGSLGQTFQIGNCF